MEAARTLLVTCTAVCLCAAYRLPNHVLPEKYTLDVITHLGSDGEDDYGFEGRVWIEVRALSPTDNIVLHNKGLDIDDKELTVTERSESDEVTDDNLYDSATYVAENDFLVMKLSRRLTKDHLYVINIPYSGNLSEGLSGYYRSSYSDKAGTKRWLAVTHFEPSDARRAFPCFDEPEMKALFQVNLGRRENYKSASNMPIKTTEPMAGRAGWYWDRYVTSPKMSTYLAAFLVADLQSVSSSGADEGSVEYRIWARPEAINQTDYALEVGPKVLRYYEHYFNISYPLPKVDMAAIPDFGPGAMENWGLVTYRETALLFDPDVTSTEQKARVAYVIAHELAHQWFGNLVTMKWWSDLWLNEGFATYVGSLGVHHAHPDWEYLDSEAFEHFVTTMSLDALRSSHPISVEVGRPDEVEQIFDAISYKKGATLLRMLNHFLGEDVFRRGVSLYLLRHQYGNAVQDDLWSSLTQEAHRQHVLPAHVTVKSVMDTWTLQTGYPVLTVSRDYNLATAALTQKRYLLDESDSNDTSSECWTIPITYSTASHPTFENSTPKLWMTCDQQVTNISNMPGPDQWVIFNNRLSGLYRVQYDTRNWILISEAMNSARFQRISLLNRAQLLNDMMAFAWTGDVGYDVSLDLVRYLRQETSYMPWRTALGAFSKLHSILRRTPDYHHFRSFLKSLLRPSVQKIEDITDMPEGFLELKHHLLLVRWACRLQMAKCIQQSAELFREWTSAKEPDSDNPIPRDLRSTVYCTAVKHGGEAEWQFLYERYLGANVPSEKVTLLTSLGCTREPWLLTRCLHMAHAPGGPIRKQDSRYIFYAVANNEVGYPMAKEYFFNHIAGIHGYFRSNAVKLSAYVKALANYMFTQRELEEWRQFLADNEALLKESQRAVQQAVETVQVNVLWHRRHYQHFTSSVQQHAAT